jgi:eukaryotic-like serine/threonine-protein kinase
MATDLKTADGDNWEQLQELFHLAADVGEEERASLLAAACDDPELRAQVMALLAADDVVAVEEPAAAPPVLTGKIGPYTLLRLLGSGGIGSVYLVERTVDDILLRAALKVLGPHAAGPMFVERFLRERKILASLNHPDITRLLDAGLTENGQPYLVMEYVEGEHLTAYCDSRTLGISERLRLFLEVCKAVAHAHRSLVVHLDLKPSNILVTPDGTVKLLDFGTSKLLQQDSLLTGTVMATPGYASPEQLRNEHLTTASDMYSLGVILFELLSGGRPGGKASAAVMLERAISEREPERLTDSIAASAPERRGVNESRLRQMLRGDLATIVAKCLRPRATDRYASLDALAEDLQRYLNGWPVLARHQTTLYLVGKYVRRKRKAVIAASIVLVLILASLTYAEWRQRQAVLEGQRALRMQTFLYRLLYLANSNYTGKPTFTVAEFLESGVKLLPNYIKNPADLRKAQMSLAESMYENNDLDGAARVFAEVIPSAAAAEDYDVEAESEATAGDVAYLQGKPDLGLQLTSHALELSKKQSVSPATRLWAKVYYATNRDRLGFRTDENLTMLKTAAEEAKKEGLLPSHEIGDVYYSLGWDQRLRENYAEAEAAYTQSMQIYMRDAAAKCDLSAVYGELASLKHRRGDPQGSLPLYQQAYDGLTSCEGPESRGALEQQARMGGALIEIGRAKQALPMLEASMPAWRKVAGSSPDLAEPLLVLARAYVNTGNFDAAERTAKEALEVQAGKVAANDRRIGIGQWLWAEALSGQNRFPEALPHAEIAARILTNGVAADARAIDARAQKTLANVRAKVG